MSAMATVEEELPPDDILLDAYDAFLLSDDEFNEDQLDKIHPTLREVLKDTSLLRDVLPELSALSLSGESANGEKENYEEEQFGEDDDEDGFDFDAVLYAQPRPRKSKNRRDKPEVGTSGSNEVLVENPHPSAFQYVDGSLASGGYKDPFEDMDEYLV